MKDLAQAYFIGIFLGALVCFALGVIMMKCNGPHEVVRTIHTTDTLLIRDTIYQQVPVPEKVYIARTDTVWIKLPGDTITVHVPLHIERKEYKTDDYFAVVEGWRPELVRLDLFPEQKIVTNSVYQTVKKKPRFGVGIQAGYGYSREGPSPYIGIGLQYNILTF